MPTISSSRITLKNNLPVACCSILLFYMPYSCALPALYVPAVALYSLVGGSLSVAWYGYKVRQRKYDEAIAEHCKGATVILSHQSKELEKKRQSNIYLKNLITPRKRTYPDKQKQYDCAYFLEEVEVSTDDSALNDCFPLQHELREHFITQPNQAYVWDHANCYSVYYQPVKVTNGNTTTEKGRISLLLLGKCWKSLCEKLKNKQPVAKTSEIHHSLASLPIKLSKELLHAYNSACESEYTTGTPPETIEAEITAIQQKQQQIDEQIQQAQRWPRRYFHTMKSLKHFAWGAAITYGIAILCNLHKA